MAKKTVFFVGDTAPKRPDMDSIFEKTNDYLHSCDLLFGQLEAVVTDKGAPACQCRLPLRIYPSAGPCLKKAGFDVMSNAGNHVMDWGFEGFYDTMRIMKESGVDIVGAGNNLAEARQPIIRTLDDGTKIGFLGYCSILPQDYWALVDRPGANPMRGITAAPCVEHDQPGTPVRIFSWPHIDDLNNMIEDIHKLRPQVDILVVSQHWGIHFTPAVIADYQRIVGHYALDEGADVVIGHHTHILKGIEVYKGKPIFYSLANFATEGPAAYFEGKNGLINDSRHADIRKLNDDFKKNPKRTMPFDSCKTILAKMYLEDGKITKFTYVPVWIDDDTFVPEVLTHENPRFKEVIDYVTEITENQKIEPHFAIEGDEVRIVTE